MKTRWRIWGRPFPKVKNSKVNSDLSICKNSNNCWLVRPTLAKVSLWQTIRHNTFVFCQEILACLTTCNSIHRGHNISKDKLELSKWFRGISNSKLIESKIYFGKIFNFCKKYHFICGIKSRRQEIWITYTLCIIIKYSSF